VVSSNAAGLTATGLRVKLLRFVDAAGLRDARAVADHVRQYFRDTHYCWLAPLRAGGRRSS
jgi:hypothetical protein